MCRFLLLKSSKPINPQPILEKFATMAKNSPAYDGDWQGDGWGISYLNNNNNWVVKKSLNPIWEDENIFDQFIETKMFIIHARSASFEHHKDVIDYNQPYINEPFTFVFNGLLKKVHFQNPIPGKIGAQKLFYLLNQLLKTKTKGFLDSARNDKNGTGGKAGRAPDTAQQSEQWREGQALTESGNIALGLSKFEQLLHANVGKIQACNIGLSNKKNIYALNLFSKHPEYYRFHYLDTPDLKIICSGQLEGMELKPLTSKTIIL